MFHPNRLRNSFLQKNCKNLPQKSLHSTLNEVFFRHLKAPGKYQVMDTVEYFEDHEESVRVGYNKFGLEGLVSVFACDNN